MRVIVSASQAPFLNGGGEAHIQSLIAALRAAGHTVSLAPVPFKFSPPADVERAMRFCDGLDLSAPNGQAVDRLISLQFPGYGMRHPRHVLWLMHQYRAVYELYDARTADADTRRLREAVHRFDRTALGRIERRFANSRRVAERLAAFNGLRAEPLYHPPPDAQLLRDAEPWDYVFLPSRLERLKRQELVIDAAALWRAPVVALLSGEGGQTAFYQERIDRLGVGDKVRLVGRLSDAEKRAAYAHALAVIFPPFDEDLGYVTLEAMYAARPVITCEDSGGPLEFVEPGVTGEVVPPSAEAMAAAVDRLWADRARARRLGEAGREKVLALGLSWERVVERLLAD